MAEEAAQSPGASSDYDKYLQDMFSEYNIQLSPNCTSITEVAEEPTQLGLEELGAGTQEAEEEEEEAIVVPGTAIIDTSSSSSSSFTSSISKDWSLVHPLPLTHEGKDKQ